MEASVKLDRLCSEQFQFHDKTRLNISSREVVDSIEPTYVNYTGVSVMAIGIGRQIRKKCHRRDTESYGQRP